MHLDEDFGTITFDQGLAFSSNVGICELLANYINYSQYCDYLDKFGFFQKVNTPYVAQSLGVKNVGFQPIICRLDLVRQVQLQFCSYVRLILPFLMMEQ